MTLQDQRYRQIADRFERIARAEIGSAPSIAELCRRVGVTSSTLLRAIRLVCGTTPHRYLRILRLREARRILSTEEVGTVTAAAMEAGFRELGRFAVQYRSAFGESPSRTLARRIEKSHRS